MTKLYAVFDIITVRINEYPELKGIFDSMEKAEEFVKHTKTWGYYDIQVFELNGGPIYE